MRRRLLTMVTITFATVLAVWLVIGAWIARSACCSISPDWLATILFVIAGLNVAALAALVIWRSRRALIALAGVEVGNIIFSLAASGAVSPAWLLFGAIPAGVTALLLLLLLRSERASTPAEI